MDLHLGPGLAVDVVLPDLGGAPLEVVQIAVVELFHVAWLVLVEELVEDRVVEERDRGLQVGQDRGDF